MSVERAASRWIVSDDPDDHIERIVPYIDLGFTHLVFHAPGPDQGALPASVLARDSATPAETVWLTTPQLVFSPD